MSHFDGFSEKARLYAQYASVVDEMKTAFEESTNRFLNAVRDRVSAEVSSTLQEKTTSGYRYWWLSDNEANGDEFPQLWIASNATAIIVPGTLQVTAIASKARPDDLALLAAVSAQEGLREHCSKRPGTTTLFVLDLSYTEDDPVGEVAPVIAKVLTALNEVQESIKKGSV